MKYSSRYSVFLGCARKAAVCSLLAASGCVPPTRDIESAFSTTWESDGGVSISRLQKQLRSAARKANARVVVGVTADGIKTLSLDGGGAWTYAAKLNAPPVIAGKLVLVSSASNVTALEAGSGAKVWEIASNGGALVGAGDDGEITALTLTLRPNTQLLLVNRAGTTLKKLDPRVDLGAPGMLAGYAFVPWGSQYVSVLNANSGEEVARVVLRDAVHSALNIGGDLYFAGRGLTRFDENIHRSNIKGATFLELPSFELPGNPKWLTREKPDFTGASARNRIRIYAGPHFEEGDGLTFSAKQISASYFRVALGINPKDGSLTWVRSFPFEIVGGVAADSGFVFCSATGKVWLTAANGANASQIDMKTPLRLCVADTGDEAIESNGKLGSLAEQIEKALSGVDAEMAAAHRFLLTELAKQTDAYATKVLIEQAGSPRSVPDVRNEARKLLAKRRTGPEYLIQALNQHYDFVSGALPPPVGPIADALAGIGDTRGAPLLARHLNDPANSLDDIERTAQALSKLATAAEYEELRTFFTLYRATADEPALVTATAAVAQALFRIGGTAGREVLSRAAADPLTHPEIRRRLTDMLPRSAEIAGTRAERNERG